MEIKGEVDPYDRVMLKLHTDGSFYPRVIEIGNSAAGNNCGVGGHTASCR